MATRLADGRSLKEHRRNTVEETSMKHTGVFTRGLAALSGAFSTSMFTLLAVAVPGGVQSTFAQTTTPTTVMLETATGIVNEGAQIETAVISSAAAPAGGITVSYVITAGTATTADFNDVSGGTVTISEGQTRAPPTIRVRDDLLTEGAETFTLTLTGVTNSAQLGTVSSVTITIPANDPLTAALTGPVKVAEGDEAIYTVALSGGIPTADITTVYTVTAGSVGTPATAADFTNGVFPTGMVTIPEGSTSGIFTVATVADATVDSETLVVTLSDLTGGGGEAPELDIASVMTTITDGGVCGRTRQVREAIVANAQAQFADNSLDCSTISSDRLAELLTTLTTLVLNGQVLTTDITTLKKGDFQGLMFEVLDLAENQLETLPAGVFDGLSISVSLSLFGNQLATLPARAFDGLSISGTLELAQNQLTTLSAGVFDGLSISGTLNLAENQLETLSAGVFDGLSISGTLDLDLFGNQLAALSAGVFQGLSIRDLYLDVNQLETLPAGVFQGLSVSGALYLTDNPGAPFSLTVELERTGAVAQAASPANVRLRLVEGTPAAITVPLTIAGGSSPASEATIVAGATTSDAFMVTGAGPVTVSLGTLPNLPGAYQGLQLVKGEPLVLFDAQPSISMSATGSTVDEGATVMIAVEVSPTSSVDLTLHYTIGADTSDTTANADIDDYADANSGSIMIPANTASVSIAITATDDNLAEMAEVLVVMLDSVTATQDDAAALGTEVTNALTITANDLPEVTLAGPADIREGQTATYTVSLSTEPTADVVLSYAITGTAMATTHYEDPAPETALVDTSIRTVTMPAGSTSSTFTIATVVGAANTDIIVTLSNPMGGGSDETPAFPGNASTVAVTTSIAEAILISGPPTLSLEEGANADLTVTASSAVSVDTTVAYTVTAGTAGAEDYGVTGASITIPMGQTAAGIPVTAVDDNLFEEAETFTVRLDSATSAANEVVVSPSAAATTVTIATDATDAIVASLTGPGAVREGDTASYTVSLTGGTSTADVVVPYAVTGTAIDGTDYTAPSGSVTIGTGAASGMIEIMTMDDGQADADDTLLVTLAMPTGGGGLATSLTADDAANAVTTTISEGRSIFMGAARVMVDEGSAVMIPVNLTEAAPAGDITVSYMISTDSGPGAAAGSDYRDDTTGNVTFSEGDTVANIQVTAVDDPDFEGAEAFTVVLGTVTGDAVIATSATSTTVTIGASDPLTVALTGPPTVGEGDAANYTITLGGGTRTEAVAVVYTVTAGSVGTAATAADFTGNAFPTGTVTIPADSNSMTFAVTTVVDAMDGEAFVVTLSSLTGGGGETPRPGTASVMTTIEKRVVSLVQTSLSVNEGTDTTITVNVTPAPVSALTIRYTLGVDADPDTADADSADYTDSNSLQIEPAAGSGVITIPVEDDDIVEPVREVFTVMLDVPGAATGYVLNAPTTLVVTINEGVCDRTLQVHDWILSQVSGVTDCADITAEHLAAISGVVFLEGLSIVALKAGDFRGLGIISDLHLTGNRLTTLPAGVFDGLSVDLILLRRNQLEELPTGVFRGLSITSLNLGENQLTTLLAGVFEGLSITSLNLGGNQLEELPAGVFRGLGLDFLDLRQNQLKTLSVGMFRGQSLEELDLRQNQLTTLPAGVFDGLSVRELHLHQNQLTTLPAGVFRGLSITTGIQREHPDFSQLDLSENQLETLPAGVFQGLGLDLLFLNGNQLETLPAGVFQGLLGKVRLDGLHLLDNPGTPFSLTVELERTEAAAHAASPANVRLRLVEGTPLPITLPLTIAGGSSPASQATIVTGATASNTFMVTGAGPVTVSLGHFSFSFEAFGLRFLRGEPLVLFGAQPSISMSATGSTVDEGATVMIAVEVSPTSSLDLTLHYTIGADTSDTTANADIDDYADANSGSIMIPANTASASIAITATDDNLAEMAEVLVVMLDSVTATQDDAAALGTEVTNALTIAANDLPEVTLAGPADVLESQTATYTVSLSTEPTADVVLSYAITGTAMATTHYEDPAPETALVDTSIRTVTMPAGSTSSTFTIATVVGAANTDIIVTLSNPMGGGSDETPAFPGNASTVAVTTSIAEAILISGPPTLSLEEGANADLTVTASSAVSVDTTVAYTVTAGTAGAEDYGVTGASITIPMGQTAAGIPVTAVDDNLFEEAETFTVRLDSATSAANEVVVSPSAAATTVTIATDATDAIVASLTGPGAVREGDTASYTVSLTGGTSTADVVVPYAVTGTAIDGTDYTAPSGSVTIGTGAASGMIEIMTMDDGQADADDTLLVTLAMPTGGGGLATSLTADDAANAVTTTISEGRSIFMGAARVMVDEGSTAMIPVNLTEAAPAGDITVSYMISTDSGPGAAAGGDYRDDTTGNVTFSEGDTVANIQVTAVDDPDFEGAEAFTVVLGTVTGDAVIATSATSTTVTIGASDPLTVALTGPPTVSEGDAANYTITLGGGTRTEAVAVVYTVTAGSVGTAATAADFTGNAFPTGTVTIPADSNSMTFAVTTVVDAMDGEAFVVTLSSLTGGGGETPRPGTASVMTTIEKRVVSLVQTSLSVNEGTDTTITVNVTPAPVSTLTIRYTLGVDADPDTADADSADYTDSNSLQIEPAAGSGVITIPVEDDDIVEPFREVFTVTLDMPGAATGYMLDSPATAIVTINEGVCDRTLQVRDFILSRGSGVTDCADITAEHLAIPEGVTLDGPSIVALKAGDFRGLSTNFLVLFDTALTTLPVGVFDGLSVDNLVLRSNLLLTMLPDRVFQGLNISGDLHLVEIPLQILPARVFEGLRLSDSARLSFRNSPLGTLPAGVFRGLRFGTLVLENSQLESLPARTFDSLRLSGNLRLENNLLETLPAGVFNGLSLGGNLQLENNLLETLPAEVFNGLSLGGNLQLENNLLETLPAEVFNGLSLGGNLQLENNLLETLPAGVFNGLSLGGALNLAGNKLTVLSTGMFEGLTLGTNQPLSLDGNPGAPFTLTLELERTDAAPSADGPADVDIRLAEGAPFAVRVPLTVSGGTLSSPTATLVAGTTASAIFTVMGSGEVTVSLGTLPAVPNNYTGLRLLGGDPLVLFGTADDAAPVITSAVITSTPARAQTYATSEAIEITLTFDKTVVIDTTTGHPSLVLQVGTAIREALYRYGGRSTSTLVFQYRVVGGDEDSDGIGWAANALHLNEGKLMSRADSAASLVVPVQAAAPEHKVFVPVRVGTASNLSGEPVRSYEGALARIEVLVSPPFEDTLTLDYIIFTDFADAFTVNASIEDYMDANSGSITIPANTELAYIELMIVDDDLTEQEEIFVVTLIRVTPASGSTAELGGNRTHIVAIDPDPEDSVMASLTGPAVVREGTSGEYLVTLTGGTATADVVVRYTFAGVSSDDYTDTGKGILTIPRGSRQGKIQVLMTDDATADPGEVLVVALGEISGADGSVNPLPIEMQLVSTRISEAASVVGVTLLSVPRDITRNTYGVGEQIIVRVRFSEAVQLGDTGTPVLALNIGTMSNAELAPPSSVGTDLVFEYTVSAADVDENGLSIAADALALGGATLTDMKGTEADITLDSYAIADDLAHKVDGGQTVAAMDLSGEGSVDIVDAKLLHYALQMRSVLGDGSEGSGDEEARARILGALVPAASDAQWRGMLRVANTLNLATIDLNEDNSVDSKDSALFYYAQVLPATLENPQLRSTLLAPLYPGANDTDWQRMLSKINNLLR